MGDVSGALAIGRGFSVCCAVAAGGVDGVAAEVFAGNWVNDFDGVGVDEQEGGGAGVGGVDAEVMHATGSA